MKHIIITGANRGIGLGLTRHYLEQGDRVFATCRAPDQAVALTALQNDYPNNLSLFPLDVTCDAMIQEFARSMDGTPVDLLINNAGIYGTKSARGAAMEEFYGPDMNDLEPEEWLKVMHVNAIAPMILTTALLPLLRLADQPVIGFISTMMASLTDKTYGGCYMYSSSKTALNMVGKSLANDLIPEEKFTVVLLHPGWVKTDMGGPNAETTLDESVAGLATVLAKLTPADTGSFINFDGSYRAW